MVNHARLRMGLSGLNAHRKKYNFIPNNVCPHCGQRPEDEVHYFLKCPYFADPRTGLVGTIAGITQRTDMFTAKCPPVTKADYVGLISLILHGDTALSYDENILIFDAVQLYITQTKRF